MPVVGAEGAGGEGEEEDDAKLHDGFPYADCRGDATTKAESQPPANSLPALESGGRAGNRTQNLAIKSRLLCQLSYSSAMASPVGNASRESSRSTRGLKQ